jgi:hypothetical protein
MDAKTLIYEMLKKANEDLKTAFDKHMAAQKVFEEAHDTHGGVGIIVADTFGEADKASSECHRAIGAVQALSKLTKLMEATD